MKSIVVCGGGVIGLASALLLARDGHAVTVLEADPAPPPADPRDAWEQWSRPGVAQFRQPHNLLPRFQQILDAELPDVVERLLAAGCLRKTELTPLPPGILDRSPRPGDERFEYVTGRRPVVEAVFAAAADAEPGVTVRRGIRVSGLLNAGRHVTGVRLTRAAAPTDGAEPARGAVRGAEPADGMGPADGEELRADLVVDATGRRSRADDWLSEIGVGAPVTEREDGGFAYYSRFYRGSEMPVRRAAPFTPLGTFSLLTLPADNGTWSVTVVTSSGDAPLKALRHADVFERLVRASPAHAQWLAGEPITDVLVMAGVLDRYRRFVVGGQPLVTGFAAVGDAWACTNPSASRGLSIGLIHAQLLRDTIRFVANRPEGDRPGGDRPTGDRSAGGLPTGDRSAGGRSQGDRSEGGRSEGTRDEGTRDGRAWDEATESGVTPFYRDQVRTDRARSAEMDALREGHEPPPPDPVLTRFEAAAGTDADVFRALLESAGCLAPTTEIVARPGIKAKIEAAEPGPRFGPTRAQLLQLLGA